MLDTLISNRIGPHVGDKIFQIHRDRKSNSICN